MFACFTTFVAAGSLFLVSCDKAKELAKTASDKIKDLKSDQSESVEGVVSEVTSVGEAEGKEIIKNEKRLVILEFYSDT